MYREIDLSDWILFSSRYNSKNYHDKDKTMHLKLLNKAAVNSAEDEFEKASLLYNSGIITPRPLEIVTCNETKGVIFEYIKNKKSILRAANENPANLKEYMTRWGVALRKLHDTPCDTKVYENYQEKLTKALESTNLYDEKHKEYLLNYLKTVEVKTTYMMKDPNPSNFIFVGDKNYIIDVSDMKYGNGNFDLGKWYTILFGYPKLLEIIAKRILKADMNLLRKGWLMLLKAYYDTEDEDFIKAKTEELKVFGVLTFFVSMSEKKASPIINFLKRYFLKVNFKKVIGKLN